MSELRVTNIRPGEARFDTDDHQHRWTEGNAILGRRFAECVGCGASAEVVEEERKEWEDLTGVDREWPVEE